MNTFRYLTYPQEIIFGPGALPRLAEAAARLGWQRALLITTGSATRAGRVAQIESLLGARLAAVFDQVQPHVQEQQVAEVAALAARHNVDALIGIGGGSALGMAKAVSHAFEPTQLPIAAIPTTYAGSEMTPVFGVTRRQPDGTPLKVTVNDPRIVPALVIYDPELTLDLPPALTAATGINALAHCIEALYSITGHTLSSAAAAAGLRALSRALPRSWAAASDLAARSETLLGAHLAGASLASAAMGLHHGLCHVLGGSAGVPHGVANSIMLPHAMRFNADAAAPSQVEPWGPIAAASLGLQSHPDDPVAAAETAANRVFDLVGSMQLPQRLRDANVAETDLPKLAQLAFQNRSVQNNPKRIESPAQIEQLLHAAW